MACPEGYKPSKTLLKSSLRSRFREYPRIAALHGLTYVADSTRPKAERFGWFFCIVASTVATVGIIFTLMERFRTDPMMSSMELQYDETPLNAPRFYICPPWKSFKNIPPPEKYDDTFYERLYEWDFSLFEQKRSYPNNLDNTVYLKKLFLQNAPSCEQFIHDSEIKLLGIKRFDCSSFKVAVTTAGICFILSTSDRMAEETPLYFTFNVTEFPTRVFATISEETELLRHLPLLNFLFPSVLTTELQETSTSREAEGLTRSQRQCVFPGEQSPYVKCVLDCRIANSLKYCDCVPWYLAKVGVKECTISRYECLDRNSPKIMDSSKCNCGQSCDDIVFKNTELNLMPVNGSCGITIRPRSPLKYKRTVRFGFDDLFVSFGGIAGLFLGCSLLSLIEFGYYFSLRTYCGAVLSLPKRRHNVIKINVLDAVHPANLTTNPKRLALPKKRVTFYDYLN